MSNPRFVSSLVWRTLMATTLVFVAAAGIACKKSESAAETTSLAPSAAAPGSPGAAAPSASQGAFGKGAISGTVKLNGKAPEAKPITTPDPYCTSKGIKDEDVLVGAGGGVKNAIVRVVKGATGTYATPATPATLDQNGCMYRPRAQVVMAGQEVQIRNSDQTLHNVHAYKGASTQFNQAQIPGMDPMKKRFTDGGQILKFRCDVHPWMAGYLAVATNPFFAVSDADGAFKIEKLPAGAYTIEIWHERLGTRSVDVQVTEDKPATVAIELTAP